MPTYTFTSPEGESYDVEGPEGATEAQAFEILQSQIGDTRPKTEGRSTGKELARQAALTGRNIAEGAAGLVGIFSDPLTAMLPDSQPFQQFVSGALDRAGAPRAENAVEEVAGAGVRALSGGGGFIKGGQVLAQHGPRAALRPCRAHR